MPNEVNFGISASCLEKGLVLPCAVASLEDKGYTMDTGIPKIKAAFLKREDTDKARKCRRLFYTHFFFSCCCWHIKRTFESFTSTVASFK